MVEPQADGANLSEHLWVSCPHCLRANLRIRRAHLGRRVLCKHCGQRFRARNAHDPSATASSTQPILPEPRFSTKVHTDEKRAAVMENKPQQAPSELTERVAEPDEARRELGKTQDLLAQIERRGEDLEQQLERARQQLQHASALDAELGAVRSENDRLRAAVAQLGSQVADGARREHELWSELHETQIQWQETGAQLASIDPGSIEARARELEELRTERDRLAASQQGWQDQLDAGRMQLGRELQSFQKEAEQLRHQLESVGRERDAALEQVKSLVQERDRLAALRADDSQQHGKSLEALRHDVELARAEAGARRDDAAAAESARADLEHRLVEVEDRLRAAIETSNRLDSEARAARAEAGARRDDAAAAESARADLEHRLVEVEDRLRAAIETSNRLDSEARAARAEAGARRDDAAAAESARADLEHRLVEVEDRLRAAIETSNRLDSEARAARAQLAELQNSADQRPASAGDLEAARLRIEQLADDFRQARIANEQLRALLNVFGLVDHLESRPGPTALRAVPYSAP